MTQPTWETVNVDDTPKDFISWGNTEGQHVTGKVLAFGPAAGTDINGNPCPRLTAELVEVAASINKDGVRTDYAAGELVVVNGGPADLQRKLIAADPSAGDLIKIVLDHFVKVDKGTAKKFEVKIARGAGQAARPAPQATSSFAAAPPF
jgi:hypothetical protein